jgi:hypothetical protein
MRYPVRVICFFVVVVSLYAATVDFVPTAPLSYAGQPALQPAFFTPHASLTQDPKKQVAINRLIELLADKDSEVRGKAEKALSELGLDALNALQNAEDKTVGEIKERAAKLVQSIRAANRLPIRVNGVEFSLTVPKEWAFPKQGEFTAIPIKLQITNTSEKAYRFYLYQSLHVLLEDANGVNLLTNRGQQAKGGAKKISPVLKKGDSFPVPLYGSLVGSKTDSTAKLFCRDPFSRYWTVPDNLPKGRYHLTVWFKTSKPPFQDGEVPFWLGVAQTAEEVLVK